MSNQPDRYEKFVVPEGVKKVAFERDTKIAHAGTLIIQREDHTLGHIMRTQLFENSHVVFSGYRIPHPLEYQMLIRVQTDGRETPIAVTKKAAEQLLGQVQDLRQQFTREVQRVSPQDGRPLY